MFRLLSLLAFMALMYSSSAAGTFFVNNDGSGDFQSIQEAVDVAASGDTIRIAPGRYNEGRTWSPPGWTRFIRVMITVEELTIIGSGPDQTIIGQEEDYHPNQGLHEGIVGGSFWGNQILRIEGLKFENMGRGIEAEYISELFIKNCIFEGNPRALHGYSRSVFCYNSSFSFESNNHTGVLALLNCSTKCSVVGCSFWGTATMVGQRSLYIQGCSDAVVDGCSFNSDRTGLYLVGGITVVRLCEFVGQTFAGIYFAGDINESVEVVDSFFENQYTAIETRSFGKIFFDNLVIENVARSSFYFMYPMNSVSIHNCLLAKGERFVLHPYLEEMKTKTKTKSKSGALHFDMQDNWWATDNPDSIQAWIYDANDDPDVGFIVDWSPFLSEPVPNDSASLGDVKALFRNGGKN